MPKVWKIAGAFTIMLLLSLSLLTFVNNVDFPDAPIDPDYCTSQHKGDEAGCLADHAHNCVWCTAKAVKPACYDAEIAKQLPPSIFKCSRKPADESEEPVFILE